MVTEEDDLGPRTLWVGSLPSLHVGSPVTLRLSGVPFVFDPSLPRGELSPRWRALVREWKNFLLDDDLLLLREPAEGLRWDDLLGLGPGSTPAGDDYLAGYAAGTLWRGWAVPFSPDLRRTSWLSGEILRDSLEGRIWRRGKRLLEALAREDGEVATLAGRIVAWGHSSGRAWMAGLASALL